MLWASSAACSCPQITALPGRGEGPGPGWKMLACLGAQRAAGGGGQSCRDPAAQVGAQRPLAELLVANGLQRPGGGPEEPGGQPGRPGHSGKDSASPAGPWARQGDAPSASTHVSVNLSAAAARGGVFKSLGQAAWVEVLTPPHPRCVILGKSLSLSLGLSLLHSKMRIMLDST